MLCLRISANNHKYFYVYSDSPNQYQFLTSSILKNFCKKIKTSKNFGSAVKSLSFFISQVMWYEILPGFGIICGCVVASGLAIKTIDKLFHGKVFSCSNIFHRNYHNYRIVWVVNIVIKILFAINTVLHQFCWSNLDA